MNPTRLRGPITDRDADPLDVSVLEAMLLQALGPGTDAMFVDRSTEGTLTVQLTPLGRATLTEMSLTTDPTELEGWMEILAPGLVEDALDVAGPQWRAEAELAVELLAAERADEMALLARLAIDAPLVIDASRSLHEILVEAVCDPALIALV